MTRAADPSEGGIRSRPRRVVDSRKSAGVMVLALTAVAACL
jgi:hypothetical protein